MLQMPRGSAPLALVFLLFAAASAVLFTLYYHAIQVDDDPSPAFAPRPSFISSNTERFGVQSPSVSPLASSSAPLVTRHSCTRSMGTWGEVCVYHNVCWDGESWLVLREDGASDHRTARMVASSDDQLEGIMFPRDLETISPRSVDNHLAPANSDMCAKLVHPSSITRNANVTWFHGSAWRLAFSHTLTNVWYLASRVLPLYTALRMNDTGELSLPPLERDDIIFARSAGTAFADDWSQTILELASRGHPRFEFRDSEWGRRWSPVDVVCMDTAVALGSIGPVMPDLETAFAFREDVYKLFHRRMPQKPARKVLFWLRPDLHPLPSPRTLINTHELLQVVEDYDIPYTVLYEYPKDFGEQLALFASHGILVSAHGAGLTNALFLPPTASVIEIFQVHHDHNLYSLLAMSMGVGHYPLHAYNGSEMWSTNPLNWKHNCDGMSSLEVNYIGPDCREGAVYFRIHVPVREFEVALVNAVNHAGYKIRLKDATARS